MPLLAGLVAIACSPFGGQANSRPLPFVKSFLGGGHRFIVVAHRGNHVLAPENSRDAIAEAIRVGADFVELDLRSTKDGTVVLMHDGTVDRTTSGRGKVADFTLEAIRRLSLRGSRRAWERVPTFEEALQDCRGKIRVYMDIKDVSPSQVLPLVRKFGMENKVIAYLYGSEERDRWRREAPRIAQISDLEEMKNLAQIEEDWRKSPFAITDGNAMEYREDFVRKWHELKVAVVPDIQNPAESPAQWRPFIEMGVDGFQTDHPEALIGYLKEIGIR